LLALRAAALALRASRSVWLKGDRVVRAELGRVDLGEFVLPRGLGVEALQAEDFEQGAHAGVGAQVGEVEVGCRR
jgi:hypothetical protein